MVLFFLKVVAVYVGICLPIAIIVALFRLRQWRGLIRETCGAEFERFLRWYDVLAIRRGIINGEDPLAIAAVLQALR